MILFQQKKTMNDLVATEQYPSNSPGKILQKLFAKEISGRLTIYDVSDESVQWKVYVGKGKVLFATSTIGHSERLNYFLNRYFADKNFEVPSKITDDYQYVYNLWVTDYLSKPQACQILVKSTQEALIHSLSLPKTNYQFEKNIDINPVLLAVSGHELVKPVKKQIRSWIQMRSEITSPFQRVSIQELEKIVNQGSVNVKYIKLLDKLKQCPNEHPCIYQIAQQVSQHTLEIALLLQPLVNSGGLNMLPYKLAPKESRPLIACIDDSKSIQRIVKMTLEASGFRVISILDPATAMTSFVTEKPDMILMDVNMPEIDGYKLSYMFRQSSLLRDIPIIILTGRDGDLDRVRAKMVGALDYISKPFIPQELLNPINSYLQKKTT